MPNNSKLHSSPHPSLNSLLSSATRGYYFTNGWLGARGRAGVKWVKSLGYVSSRRVYGCNGERVLGALDKKTKKDPKQTQNTALELLYAEIMGLYRSYLCI
jgi:hypothetical protein